MCSVVCVCVHGEFIGLLASSAWSRFFPLATPCCVEYIHCLMTDGCNTKYTKLILMHAGFFSLMIFFFFFFGGGGGGLKTT